MAKLGRPRKSPHPEPTDGRVDALHPRKEIASLTGNDARRLLSRIKFPDGCWEWQGSKDVGGYAKFSQGEQSVFAMRAMFEFLIEPIPIGHVIDHICRNRACVNPYHVEPVTQRENIVRGESFVGYNARKTHCKFGHAFTKENTRLRWRRMYKEKFGWARECKTCYLKKRKNPQLSNWLSSENSNSKLELPG